MAINLASKYSELVDERFLAMSRLSHTPKQGRIKSKWKPITYTPMFWWMVMNYIVLILMILLPATIIVALLT